jgi:hypothetical protein
MNKQQAPNLAIEFVKSNIARGIYATLVNKDTGTVLKTSGLQPNRKMAKADLDGASQKTLRKMRLQAKGRQQKGGLK